ncbi:MAG: hypothetical protein H3Z53_02420 [archaeon]|nr:hypothetical protein [archaeon]MCP8313214.1 hypothetical protein [archaeon]MCP8316052.1 hypothetical protein [archaeon]MCP8320560.1 hypothetical protein [archaeon]
MSGESTEEPRRPIGIKLKIKSTSYLKVIPASIAILLTIYMKYGLFEPEIENIRMASNFLILLLILFIIVRIDATIPNIIIVTTLVTPLILLIRLLVVLFIFSYLEGVLFYGMTDFLGFLSVFAPLLAISLALIDKLVFHKLGYRKTILPILLPSLVLFIASGISPLELGTIGSTIGLWVIPLLYVIIGPFIIKRIISRQDFNIDKVEDAFFVVFGLNSYTMSFFIGVFVENFASWGSLNYIPIEILFASLLFPWSIFWAVSEGFKTNHLKSLILLLLFYGFSFLLLSLSYIITPGVYPTWSLQTGYEFPSLFSILLYLLYAIIMPIIAIRGYKYAKYLYSVMIFLLPIVVKVITLRLIGSYVEASTGDALIAIISVISAAASLELVRKEFKEKEKT